MMTPEQENELMLASIIGISEGEAAARLNKKIAVTCSDGAAYKFGQVLIEQLNRTVIVSEASECDLEILVGAPQTNAAVPALTVTLNSERLSILAGAQKDLGLVEPVHGLIREIAACYVAGVSLNKLLQLDFVPKVSPFIVNFDKLGLNEEFLAKEISFENTALIGAGAVGNGFLRAIRHLKTKGQLEVVDPKSVGGGNPNRCLYFSTEDVGHSKAERLSEKAASDFADLILIPRVSTYSALVNSQGPHRRVFVATDSRRVRRTIQKDFPLQVIDASTTGVEEIVVHSHRQPNNHACLACIYRHIPDELSREREIAVGLGIDIDDLKDPYISHEVAKKICLSHTALDASTLVGKSFDSLFKQLCGEQALLSPTGAQVLAPFAFVSNLAGAMMAIELIRFDHGLHETNYFYLSPWAPPNSSARLLKGRRIDCEFCGKEGVIDLWKQVWPDEYQ